MWVSCLHATAVAVRTSSESVPLLELLQEYDGLYYFSNRPVALFLLFCMNLFARRGDLHFWPAAPQMLRFHRRARSLAWWGIRLDVERVHLSSSRPVRSSAARRVSLGGCCVRKHRKELSSDEPAFLAPPLKAGRVAIDRSSTEACCMQATRPALFLYCVLP